jgi:hypothetical protein
MLFTFPSRRSRGRQGARTLVFGALVALVAVLVAPSARAQEATTGPDAPTDPPSATLLHRPPATWLAGLPQRLEAVVERDWEVARVIVGVRAAGQAEFETLEMGRTSGRDQIFRADVPADRVQPPGLEYFIATADASGRLQPRFASQERPHSVLVTGTTERAERLERHHGHRSSLRLSGEWTRYGTRRLGPWVPVLTEPGSDMFWTVGVDYRYRLMGVLYDIHFGLRGLRGGYARIQGDDGGGTSDALSDPAFYSGHAGITLEAHRLLSFETDLIVGATESGFAAGVSGLVRIGRIAATRLELSGEYNSGSGSVGTLRFAWDTVPYVPMALAVELNDFPAGDTHPVGTRLLYDIGAEVSDAVTLAARVGYAARSDSVDGGWVLGLASTYEF